MPVTVQIVIPEDGSDVEGGGTFQARGTVNPPPGQGSSVAATCDNQDGDPAQPPTGFDWAFDFTGVTVGEFRDLVVEAVNGSESDSDTHSIRCID